VSNSLRMALSVILVIVGILALVVAVIYLTTSIHSLPSFIPGKHVGVNGHYHKRGAIAAVIGIVLIAIGAVIGLRGRRQVTAPASPASPATPVS
jgi:uncharacterized membrane protein